MYYMCIFLLFSLVNVSWQAQEFGEIVERYIEFLKTIEQPCVEETKVDPEFVHADLLTTDISEDRNLKCFYKCIYTQLGAIDLGGNVKDDVMIDVTPVDDKEVVAKAIQKCKKTTKDEDLCDFTYGFVSCLHVSIGEMLST